MTNRQQPYGVIYVITNLVDGKQYVGQTKQTAKDRFQTHHHGDHYLPLSRAIKRYGPHSFRVETVQQCPTQRELDTAEIAWTTKLNSLAPNGYNLLIGRWKRFPPPRKRRKRPHLRLPKIKVKVSFEINDQAWLEFKAECIRRKLKPSQEVSRFMRKQVQRLRGEIREQKPRP